MMGPGLVPWHVKLEYYFYCHCTNLTIVLRSNCALIHQNRGTKTALSLELNICWFLTRSHIIKSF